jgi:nitrite reductase (NO-forming)
MTDLPKQPSPTASTWTAAAIGAARAAFGIVWAVDAYLAWRPEFAAHYVGYLQNAATGQPSWLKGWFALWLGVVSTATPLFVALTRAVETLLAVALLSGFARRTTYLVGAVFSLMIWATGEGFSGPYAHGAANLGPALVYVLVFVALLLCERAAGPLCQRA